MTWRSAFSGGRALEVQVYPYVSSPLDPGGALFDQSMTAAQTSASFGGSNGETLTVAVDANGSVTLAGDAGSGTCAGQYVLCVLMGALATSFIDWRMHGFTIGATVPEGVLFGTSNPGQDGFVILSRSGSSLAPDPFDMGGYWSPPDRFGLYLDGATAGVPSGALIQFTPEYDDGGVTPPSPPPPPSPTRIVELRTSKDGAHNFGYWRQYDMGGQGRFNNQPVFRRLGLGRRIVMHIRTSADCNRDVVACSVDTEPF